MTNENNKSYQIYSSLIGMALTFALILWVNEHFVLKVNFLVCILYSLVPAILIYLFERNKKNNIRYIIIIGLTPVVGLILLITRINPIKLFTRIIDWIIIYDRTELVYKPLYAYIALASLAVLVSILFYIIISKAVTRLLLGLGIVVVFVVFSILKINMGKIVVGIGILYLLIILIEFTGIQYGIKTGKKDNKESNLYLLPVCILLSIIVVSLPSKPKPIQWTGVKSFYSLMKNRIENLITEWEFFTSKGKGTFSISLSGYSEDSSLDNNDLVSSDREALIVSGRRGISPLYLIGSVRDIYTGDSWDRSTEVLFPDEREYKLDYGELIYGLSRLDPKVLEDYRFVETVPIKITYKNIKTKSFFYPSKTKWLEFSNVTENVNSQLASITFKKARGEKTAYDLLFYEMNLQGPEFQEMLRSSDEFSYDDSRDIDLERINSAEKMFYVRDKDTFILDREDFYNIYKERAEFIKNRYTQLPQNLPTRVIDLAYEITKDKDTSYDKLKAIEAYLLNYSYTYKPGKVPEDADFVDYFLFDNKQGYCTSFATAMAVLGRGVGIPTRYVEGFIVDYSDKDDIGYIVRNRSAHAWTEAYFEGVGWIPFEATPSYNEARYREWAPKRRAESTSYNPYDMKPTEQPPEGLINNNQGDFFKEDNSDKILISIVAILVAIAIFLIVLELYYLILRLKYKKKFERSDYSIKTYKIFLRILNLLKYEGFSLGNQDTLLMLSSRIKDRYSYKQVIFGDVVKIFMAYRYGDIPVSDKEYDKVSLFYKGLYDSYKKERKPIRLHIEEFSFLIGINSQSK